MPSCLGTFYIRQRCSRRIQQMLPGKIAEAERAILNRVKELFQVQVDHIEEDQILDDARYALRALRNCVVPESTAA